jgi:pimeloyl-ACP methyl ester carboxylesterase
MRKEYSLILSKNLGGSTFQRLLSLFAIQLVKYCVTYLPFPAVIMECVKHGCRWYSGVNRFEVMVDDHRWAYLAGGRGEVILFVHGFGANKDRFGIFLSAFSPCYRVIAPDLPGFGENIPIYFKNYDIPSQVNRLNRFSDAIGLDKFHLFGISMGGYVCGYYASEYPDRILSLSLMDSAGVTTRIPSDAWIHYITEGRNVLLYKTPEQFDELVSFLFFNPPQIPRHFKKYFAREGERVYALRKKLITDIIDGGLYLLDNRLSEIRAETLAIWGAEDRMVHRSAVEVFEKGINNCRSVIFKECGHLPFIEKSLETKWIYKRFLESLSR